MCILNYVDPSCLKLLAPTRHIYSKTFSPGSTLNYNSIHPGQRHPYSLFPVSMEELLLHRVHLH
uniref:Uncharacterized protein n=1 Tax=Utricularia reniformis TaxID=192314 RepID=A0A1Y0B0U6_9LAMI|nr:hypothetical protein AEK19_MT0764 [Utricularia reniformis]ART31007.1 hypothetical protein AEK19_MT0764 [Utricularia reniformis]